MRETDFCHEMCDLWGFTMVLCDLLDDDPQCVLDSYVVLEEARTVQTRDELSPEAEQILTAMELFVEDCRGWWGVAHPVALLGQVDAVQQRLAVEELSAVTRDEAHYWRRLLEASIHTGHPDLPGLLEQAEAYLAAHD